MVHPKYHHRQSTRRKGYDYAGDGAYFLTLCVHQRKSFFGTIINDEMHLNDAGRAIESEWHNLTTRFPRLVIDELIVMPNHLHGILGLVNDIRTGEPCVRPAHSIAHGPVANQTPRPQGTLPESIGRIVQAFKSLSANRYIAGVKQSAWARFNGQLWQRNYYDHIIRNDRSLDRIREYIATNPLRWALDQENPDGDRTDDIERFIRMMDEEFSAPLAASHEGEHEVRPYGASRAH